MAVSAPDASRVDVSRNPGDDAPLLPAGARARGWTLRKQLAVALAVAALNVAVKLPHLGANDLWLDEAVAVHTAQLDAGGIVEASRGDTTPPVYYLVLGAFERVLGISEGAVRIPGVLASAATASALFLLAYRWIGGFAAAVVSVLFLFSDVNLAYAREARPYTLASLLCVVSFALFLEARRRGSWRWWMLVAVTNAAMILTHYVTAFAVAAQALSLAFRPRTGRDLLRFAVAHLPVAAGVLAWIRPLMSAQQYLKMGWLPPPTVFHAAKLLAWFSGGHRGFPGFLLLSIGSAVALTTARVRNRGPSSGVTTVLALWGFAPVPLAMMVSYLGVHCFHARYLLYASSGLLLLWAAGAQALPKGRWRAVGTTVACSVAALGFGRSAVPHGTAWKSTAALVRSYAPGNVLLLPYWESTSFAYYYDRGAFVDARHTEDRLATDGVHVVVDAAAIDALDRRDREVVLVDALPAPADRPIMQALARRGFREVDRHALAGVTVLRLVRTDAALR